MMDLSFPPNKRHQKVASPQSLERQNGDHTGHDDSVDTDRIKYTSCEKADTALARLMKQGVLTYDPGDTGWTKILPSASPTGNSQYVRNITINASEGEVQARVCHHTKGRVPETVGKIGFEARGQVKDTTQQVILDTQAALWKECNNLRIEQFEAEDAQEPFNLLEYLCLNPNAPHKAAAAASPAPPSVKDSHELRQVAERVANLAGARPTRGLMYGVHDAPNVHVQTDIHPKIDDTQPPTPTHPVRAPRSQGDQERLGATLQLSATTEAQQAPSRPLHVHNGVHAHPTEVAWFGTIDKVIHKDQKVYVFSARDAGPRRRGRRGRRAPNAQTDTHPKIVDTQPQPAPTPTHSVVRANRSQGGQIRLGALLQPSVTTEAQQAPSRLLYVQNGVNPTCVHDAPNAQTDTHPKIVDTQPATPTHLARAPRSQDGQQRPGAPLQLSATTEAQQAPSRLPHVQNGVLTGVHDAPNAQTDTQPNKKIVNTQPAPTPTHSVVRANRSQGGQKRLGALLQPSATTEAQQAPSRLLYVQNGVNPTCVHDALNAQTDTHPKIVDTQP
eukprot:CAMPEP_0198701904 /NCGR_PEP_ID=MMETSP1468-20131203/388455_1 /TAXON_ID=1461545 /ORGANISM="Mantoniella sp, Strain CCMP1436" /LENGTH=556 /DNA_ID=CAMNT_0044460355 /DNA_START=415 /DNA_END=2081 /DNA_ORIENTATION=+